MSQNWQKVDKTLRTNHSVNWWHLVNISTSEYISSFLGNIELYIEVVISVPVLVQVPKECPCHIITEYQIHRPITGISVKRLSLSESQLKGE